MDSTEELKEHVSESMQAYRQTGLLSSLERYMTASQRLLDIAVIGHADRADYLLNLAVGYYDRYVMCGTLSDLECAIQRYQEVINLTLNDHPDKASRLQGLGNGYLSLYQLTQSLDDLDAAICRRQEAVGLTPPDHPDFIYWVENLTMAYQIRYAQSESMTDLEHVIRLDEMIVNGMPDHPKLLHRLERLAKAYKTRYERSQSVTDLEHAIRLDEMIVDGTPDDHPHRLTRLHGIAAYYHIRYEQTAALDDLDIAIKRYDDALCHVSDPDRVHQLESLSRAYRERHMETGQLEDLDLAVQLYKEVIDLTPHDHSDRAGRLANLGSRFRARHLLLGGLDDINLSIDCYLEAFNLTPEDDDARIRRLKNLALSLSSRNRRTGSQEDAELAIQYFRETLDLTPNNDLEDKSFILHALGVEHNVRFHSTGRSNDIELAIQLCQEAISIMADEHSDRSERLQSLATAYHDRYSLSGLMEDLELCIGKHEEAISLVGDDHPERPRHLQSLAIVYKDRNERSGDLKDLELSISCCEQAADLTPDISPEKPARLGNLGLAYLDRFHQTEALDDLELAISRKRKAITMMPDDYPDRVSQLVDLGIILSIRYERTMTPIDLDQSILHLSKGIELTPDFDYHRAGRLSILGSMHRDRYQLTKNSSDLKLCCQLFKDALNCTFAPPIDRFFAGRKLLNEYVQTEDWIPAYDDAVVTISLIPLFAPRSAELSDLQHQVGDITGLASQAASIALRAGKPVYEAIKLLEIGRSTITNSLGATRMDTTDLSAKSPDLAVNFNRLRDLLENHKGGNQRNESNQRYSIGKQLEEVIQEIRTLPDFDRFLLGPSEDEMRRAAVNGPIVIVNSSDLGCHALIIEYERFQLVELSLDPKEIRSQAEDLVNPKVEILEWLWDSVASPVLDILGFIQNPSHSSAWPRIWWILTGYFARFPIHAAGRYQDDDKLDDTVMDRVISSYSSSVRAIINAYKSISVPAIPSKEQSMVLLGLSQTPGYLSLSSVPEEVKVVTELGRCMQFSVVQPPPYRENTLLALRDCTIFHFVGHGHSDSSNPSDSALILSDGRLTVESMFNVNLHQNKPFLAYLSACGTGQIKHDSLFDEELHLIGACQLAGFRHVIGTLWKVNDDSCVDVARDTYQWICDYGLSDLSVSSGLHHACRNLRSQWSTKNKEREAFRNRIQTRRQVSVISNEERSYSDQAEQEDTRDIEAIEDLPLHWVPYVHFGI